MKQKTDQNERRVEENEEREKEKELMKCNTMTNEQFRSKKKLTHPALTLKKLKKKC